MGISVVGESRQTGEIERMTRFTAVCGVFLVSAVEGVRLNPDLCLAASVNGSEVLAIAERAIRTDPAHASPGSLDSTHPDGAGSETLPSDPPSQGNPSLAPSPSLEKPSTSMKGRDSSVVSGNEMRKPREPSRPDRPERFHAR